MEQGQTSLFRDEFERNVWVRVYVGYVRSCGLASAAAADQADSALHKLRERTPEPEAPKERPRRFEP